MENETTISDVKTYLHDQVGREVTFRRRRLGALGFGHYDLLQTVGTNGVIHPMAIEPPMDDAMAQIVERLVAHHNEATLAFELR